MRNMTMPPLYLNSAWRLLVVHSHGVEVEPSGSACLSMPSPVAEPRYSSSSFSHNPSSLCLRKLPPSSMFLLPLSFPWWPQAWSNSPSMCSYAEQLILATAVVVYSFNCFFFFPLSPVDCTGLDERILVDFFINLLNKYLLDTYFV